MESAEDWGGEQLSRSANLFPAGRAEEAIASDFDASPGEDVLEEPADELHARQRHMANLMSFVVAILESNGTLVDGFQAAIGDGNPEDVAGQIL